MMTDILFLALLGWTENQRYHQRTTLHHHRYEERLCCNTPTLSLWLFLSLAERMNRLS